MSQCGGKPCDTSTRGLARFGFGDRELQILLAVLILVSGIWFLWWLTDHVTSGNTHELDERLLVVLRNPDNPETPIGPRWVKEVATGITKLGGFAFLTGLTISVSIFLGIQGKHHASLLLIGATTGGFAIMHFLKALINRPRPDVVPALSHVTDASFPSGHAMLSAVVYLVLGAMLARLVQRRRLKLFFLLLALVLTFLIGISRVYLGVHYPTDILAGWAAGLIWAIVCWLVTRVLQHSGLVEFDPVLPSDSPQAQSD